MPTTNRNDVADAVPRTVTLTDKQYEGLMTGILAQIATSATIAEEKAVDLKDTRPREGSLVEDTQLAFRILREDLDTIEALGWPEGPEDR